MSHEVASAGGHSAFCILPSPSLWGGLYKHSQYCEWHLAASGGPGQSMVPPWTCHGTIEPFDTLQNIARRLPKLPVSPSRNINTSNGKGAADSRQPTRRRDWFLGLCCEAWRRLKASPGLSSEKRYAGLLGSSSGLRTPSPGLAITCLLKAHHLADLVQQLELRIGNEPLTRSGRLCISNIEPHLLQKNLWTATLASFILLT